MVKTRGYNDQKALSQMRYSIFFRMYIFVKEFISHSPSQWPLTYWNFSPLGARGGTQPAAWWCHRIPACDLLPP